MKKIILLFCLLQVGILFLFYPKFYGIYDEDIYLTTTYALQNGSFFYEKAEVSAPLLGTVKGDNGTFSIYPPGNSVLLLPFTLIHWRLGFLKNIFLYIGSFLLFVFILRKLNVDTVYSLIFLFHPTLVLFSRTLMSDIPSMFFLLLGIFFMLDRKNVAAGFSLGFLFSLRYPNLIIIVGIVGFLLFRKEYRRVLFLLPGIALFSSVLLIYLMHTYGFILGPFTVSGAGAFSIQYFICNLPYYLLSLNVLYPFMLIVAIFFGIKNKKLSIFVITASIVIIFYSFYYYIDGGNSVMEKLIKGQRFMIPIIPLLLIPYLDCLQNKRFTKKVFVFVIPLLFVLNCTVQYKHQQFVRKEKQLSEILMEKSKDMDIILCNFDTDELLNPYFIKAKIVELSKVKKNDLDSLKNKYNVSFVFTELKRGKDFDEKSKWVEYFKQNGFTVSYESQNPIPVIIMTE
jgi:hypothetical protein